MRLWSLHPKYLDARGLVALWREGLLAQAVLRGRTRGYTRHPQLERFRSRRSPVGAIAQYLRVVHAESRSRGYRFAASKIDRARDSGAIAVTRGQIGVEWKHLMAKLADRDPARRARLAHVKRPAAHPSFRTVPGESACWERARPRTVERNRATQPVVPLESERARHARGASAHRAKRRRKTPANDRPIARRITS
jgi:hypothetical protein